MARKILTLFLFLALAAPICAQIPAANDSGKTIPKKKIHKKSPGAALLMSAVVPGLGQAYNRKYWKMPIIYAGMGTTIYFFRLNHTYYKDYHQAYLDRTDTLASTVDAYPLYSDKQLKELADYHRKYRDLNVILTALCYTINLVDAYVDAHLSTFDVSDDLTLTVLPQASFAYGNRRNSLGVYMALRF